MAFVDNLVRINITQAATPVSATQTNIPVLISDTNPNWSDGKVAHIYGSLSELVADGFPETSDTYAYATKLLGSSASPSTFVVAVKAGTTLASSDLDALLAQNTGAYAHILVKGTDAEILTAATWMQAQNKMLFAASATEANGDPTSTTSVAYELNNQNLTRTALMFSPGSAGLGIEAAWVGECINAIPGTFNWAYQTLAGISTDTLTTAQLQACIGSPVDEVAGNGANCYITQFQRGVTLKGTTSGSYIDVVMAEDYLRFQLQAALFTVMASGQKNPLTNKGVAVFVAAVKSVLDTAANLGIINPTPGTDANGNQLPGITVTVADVGTLSATDRAARLAPPINFTCTLSGCVDAIAVNGQISL